MGEMNKLSCSDYAWVNLTPFNIFLVGKGFNKWSSGALAMKRFIK